MAKDTEEKVEVLEPKTIYILAYKDGRRLFHAEYFSKEHVLDRIQMLMARKVEIRVEYRDMTGEERNYYATV